MSTIQEFEAAAAKATQASAQADIWANGPINTTVPTDSGQVPTIAEFNRAAQARVDASIDALGWVLAGDFTAGCTVTDRNQYALVVGGAGYRWDGVLPKVVAPGSSPTPIATGSWVLVGDMSLRGDLAAASGADIVGFQQEGAGSVPRTAQDKLREHVSLHDFGGVGDGTTDNASVFISADALGRDILIVGNGTYLTTYEPISRVYTDAKAKIKIGGVTITLSQVPLQITAIEQAEFDDTLVRLSNTLVGIDAAPSLLSNANSYGNTAYGTGAMQNAVEAKRVTAIGPFAVRDPIIAYSVTGIGTTTLEWMAYGDRLTFVGDNSGKNLGNPTPVGRHAYFDPANPNPNDWDTRWPAWRAYAGAVNAPAQVMTAGDFGNKATHMVGVGRNAFGFSLTAKDAVALGYDAGTSVLYGQDNVFVGDRAGQWTIKANFTTAVGSKVMRYLMDSDQDTAVGNSAMFNYVHSSRNVAMGYQALAGFQCNLTDVPLSNVAIGRISMANCVGNVSYNVAVGEGTLAACRSNENTAIGTSALNALSDPAKGRNTAVGRSSLLVMQDGTTPATSLLQCSALGYGTRVSGDDQVQLGGSTSTTYVYGTVQNRSDARDKTGDRNTELGIEFILGLRPVDYRWNMRDDYIEYYEQQIGIDPETAEPIFETRTRLLENDGSKARARYHHGFIAQEVKALTDKLGVDFGGYQDHKINGGCDVLSIGYDEFIAPAVKAIQQCWERMDSIEARLNKAGL